MSKKPQLSFADRMTQILNESAVNLAIAIGYRTGIFDRMQSMPTPCSAAAIADACGLDHRYVREWLCIVGTAGIVDMSDNGRGEACYFLPPDHAALLARSAGPNNLAMYAQEIPLLTTCALEPVIQGFTTGQGVSYDHYPQFQAFMTGLSDAKMQRVLIDEFLPSIDSGRLIEVLRQGIRVCDLGCGEGVAVVLMAGAFPASRFTGIDIDPTALSVAKAKAADQGLSNIDFQTLDAAEAARTPNLANAFDYITAFDSIHDQTRPLQALQGIYHMLSPGGLFSMIDIAAHTNVLDNRDHPLAPFLYTVSLMHCMPVGKVDNGAGLGMMWGREQALDMLRHAGFDAAEAMEMPNDVFNLHFCCRKSDIQPEER
jgi:ubiquinone/menaquinone biosynthesis C-methylase UbiE